MKNYKGGYLLISLGMIALASLTALPSGTVEKIKASSKRIVLTDISLDGVKQENDITVQPIISGTSVIIKGVYGKDITIASDDSVIISNSQSGITIYKHEIKKGTTIILSFLSPNKKDITTYGASLGIEQIIQECNKNAPFLQFGSDKHQILKWLGGSPYLGGHSCAIIPNSANAFTPVEFMVVVGNGPRTAYYNAKDKIDITTGEMINRNLGTEITLPTGTMVDTVSEYK